MNKRLKSLLSLGACGFVFSFSAVGCKSEPVAEDPFLTNAYDYEVVEEVRESELDQEKEPRSDNTGAKATLKPTKGNKAKGTITFTAVKEGVKIVADFSQLTQGKHGLHIHEKGDCSADDASSAGGHFNPTNSKHGGPDSAERHAGDLGNVVADQDGNAHYERIDRVIKLDGPNSIIGRSIIIHSKEDDFKTQPAGDSGSRIACGVIEANNK